MEHFNVIKRFTFCLRCTASGSSLQNVSVAVLLFIPVQHNNDWDTIGPVFPPRIAERLPRGIWLNRYFLSLLPLPPKVRKPSQTFMENKTKNKNEWSDESVILLPCLAPLVMTSVENISLSLWLGGACVVHLCAETHRRCRTPRLQGQHILYRASTSQ